MSESAHARRLLSLQCRPASATRRNMPDPATRSERTARGSLGEFGLRGPETPEALSSKPRWLREQWEYRSVCASSSLSPFQLSLPELGGNRLLLAARLATCGG